MHLYLTFTPGWLSMMGIVYGSYLVVYLSRNKKSDKILPQIKFGLIALIFGIVLEFIGVSLKLWTILPANFPLAIWISYFGAGLLVYQVMKKLEEYK